MDTGVEYRDVPDFPFYRAGSDGSVWSCRTRGGRLVPWSKMTPVIRKQDGRPVVGFRKDGRLYVKEVHVVILTAFVGACPPGLEGCHGDGDPTNNAVGNLRWDTHVANMADRQRHGTVARGERNPSVKLTEAQVLEIRARCVGGEQQKVVARDYGINASCVQKIVSRQSWAWLGAKAA